MGYRLKKMGLVTLDIRDGDARTPQISHRWMEQLEVPVTKTVWLIRSVLLVCVCVATHFEELSRLHQGGC